MDKTIMSQVVFHVTCLFFRTSQLQEENWLDLAQRTEWLLFRHWIPSVCLLRSPRRPLSSFDTVLHSSTFSCSRVRSFDEISTDFL